jgi:hypothetical protein
MIRNELFRWIGISLAVLSGLTELLSGPGTRWGWWEFPAGLGMLRWAAIGGLAAAALSLAAFFIVGTEAHQGRSLAILGLLLGLLVAAIPVTWLLIARNVPRIHDITTDTDDPPRYVAVLLLRSGASNPVEYEIGRAHV